MLLIPLSPESEALLQHQRLKGETLEDAIARIIRASYAVMLSSGDPRVP